MAAPRLTRVYRLLTGARQKSTGVEESVVVLPTPRAPEDVRAPWERASALASDAYLTEISPKELARAVLDDALPWIESLRRQSAKLWDRYASDPVHYGAARRHAERLEQQAVDAEDELDLIFSIAYPPLLNGATSDRIVCVVNGCDRELKDSRAAWERSGMCSLCFDVARGLTPPEADKRRRVTDLTSAIELVMSRAGKAREGSTR
jgi:hypothetical protein